MYEENRPWKCFAGLGSYILDAGTRSLVGRGPSGKHARDNYPLRHLVNNYLGRLAAEISVRVRGGI